MRTLTTILLAGLLFVSCSKKESSSLEDVIASNNLETIRAKKAELDTKQQEIASQLETLNKKISELDVVMVGRLQLFRIDNNYFFEGFLVVVAHGPVSVAVDWRWHGYFDIGIIVEC